MSSHIMHRRDYPDPRRLVLDEYQFRVYFGGKADDVKVITRNYSARYKGRYDPNNSTITLYKLKHKDVEELLDTYAHELAHHVENILGIDGEGYDEHGKTFENIMRMTRRMVHYA